MGCTRLNPTLDWICALTYTTYDVTKAEHGGLNPTLDWICALTTVGMILALSSPYVLILLWTGYVL